MAPDARRRPAGLGAVHGRLGTASPTCLQEARGVRRLPSGPLGSPWQGALCIRASPRPGTRGALQELCSQSGGQETIPDQAPKGPPEMDKQRLRAGATGAAVGLRSCRISLSHAGLLRTKHVLKAHATSGLTPASTGSLGEPQPHRPEHLQLARVP